MNTSRIGWAALLTWGCLQAGAVAGSIFDEPDLAPHWRWRPPAVQTVRPTRRDLALAVDADRVEDRRAATVSGGQAASRTHADAGPRTGRMTAVAATSAGNTPSQPSTSSLTASAARVHTDSGPPIAPVPEPSGVALAVTGLGALAFAARWMQPRDV